MNESSIYVSNLNRALKSIKSDIIVDFICSDAARIIVVTNKVTISSDLQSIKHYVKDTNCINSNKVNSPRFLQSKSYLKIISLLYLQKNTAISLNSNVIKSIIKVNHIFNNIILALKPHVIKVFLKSDIAIVWIDIWNVQSRSNTKMLINRCFNVGNYIATIWRANMNPRVSQCKNCWR